MIRVAALQMVSGPDVAENLDTARDLIREAAGLGAQLVALPENFALMPVDEAERLRHAEADGAGPMQDFLASEARAHGLWLVGGTVPLTGSHPDRVRAVCGLYDDRGERVARYDKIHLFDVVLDSGERYMESAQIEPGDTPVVAETPFGRLGLAICYDLRFPELFRRLLDQGADLFVVPSAFTARTGRAHWELLTRARAVENLAWLMAPAQGGRHANGRETYGDSLIVNPWGEVLNRLAVGSGVVVADLDPSYAQQVRTAFPSIHHRRLTG